MSRLIDADKTIHNLKKWSDISPTIQRRNEDFINILKNEDIVKAIPLDKVKKVREEIENEIKFWSEPSKYNVKPIDAIKNAKVQSYKHCLEILDKLIAENE